MADDEQRNAIAETLMQRAAMEGSGMGAMGGAAEAMAPDPVAPPPSVPADPAMPQQAMSRHWSRRGGFDPSQAQREWATSNPGVDPGSVTDPLQQQMSARAAMRQAQAGVPNDPGMTGLRAPGVWSGSFGPDVNNFNPGQGGMFGNGGGMSPPTPASGGMMGGKGAATAASGQPSGSSGFGGKATPGAAPSMMGA